MKEQTFKIGDRIKAVRDLSGLSLTYGRVYEVLEVSNAGSPCIINDRYDRDFYSSYRFKLAYTPLSLSEQVKIAESLIGKRVIDKDKAITGYIQTFTHLSVTNKWGDNCSALVKEYLTTHEYCVVLHSNYVAVPYDSVELVPDEIEVKLNDTYTAKVTKDSIKVGCQTFPVSILKELNEALKNL